MTNERTIETIVCGVIRERFGDVRIAKIDAKPGFDEDGDQVWYVKVVLENSDVNRIDARRASGVVRHLLPKMVEAGDNGFPILSFIAKSELGKHSPEAA